MPNKEMKLEQSIEDLISPENLLHLRAFYLRLPDEGWSSSRRDFEKLISDVVSQLYDAGYDDGWDEGIINGGGG